jgi:hypothetical protein
VQICLAAVNVVYFIWIINKVVRTYLPILKIQLNDIKKVTKHHQL